MIFLLHDPAVIMVVEMKSVSMFVTETHPAAVDLICKSVHNHVLSVSARAGTCSLMSKLNPQGPPKYSHSLLAFTRKV